MPENTSPLLLALREGTRTHHQQLEARLPFFSTGFDLTAYGNLLGAYHGFYAPLDRALSNHQTADRSKAPALARDLRALALPIDTLPQCQVLPTIADEASALGVMYVLEGSTLGGQVLKRAMAERLGIDGDTGAAFLDVYGPLTGAHWRGFLARLTAAPYSERAQTRSVQAAVATFACFEQWLDERRVLLP
ncbi:MULTISPECIES: biliverdin-producing heme oxygenase [unclassified Pseudomonas]|uniref:biliverdin-producing heme oxygenase n=1 Tax=unclassified Pseudomonas TaxID=196821 RepID=UPI00244CAF19|nr:MULTISPECIES: biliverdin-producing heme oxygenase [unclassified Pseudomonas]MDH0302150.1 biliverdin-producing heme oxygenase [Pseudomonas sp. GD04091]MDH1987979.1 biliverdin-producing heme oxygenase [Pseudomonas sp. GD03689]